MRIKIIIISCIVAALVIIGCTIFYCNYVPDKGVLDKGTQQALEIYSIDGEVVELESKLENNTYKVIVHVDGVYENLLPALERGDEDYIMKEFYNKADAILYIPDSAKAIIGFKGFYKNSKVTLYDDKAQKKLFVVENGEIIYDCVAELRTKVAQ